MKEAAGILLISRRSGNVLFVLRNDSKPTWSFLGGGLEAGETILDCAKRELYEEASFLEGVHYSLQSHRPIHITYRNKFKYHCFIGITDDDITPTLNNEHLEYKWVPLNRISNEHFGVTDLLRDNKAMDTINTLISQFH